MDRAGKKRSGTIKKPNISAALAVYNEEQNILDCINSLKQFAFEIIVVDGNSKDRTREIAEELGATVFKVPNKKMFHINKNLAINKCKGDWIFLIDADERVTEQLAKEIISKIKENPAESGFWISRKNWFLGGFLTKGGAYPDSVIRLFKKGKGILPEKDVHEQIKITGDVGTLESDIIHLADPDFSRYLKRFDRYTAQTAEILHKNNSGINIFALIYFLMIKPVVVFFAIYIRHKGYTDGFRGFAWALFSGAHHFFAYAKYFEKVQKNSVKDYESSN